MRAWAGAAPAVITKRNNESRATQLGFFVALKPAHIPYSIAWIGKLTPRRYDPCLGFVEASLTLRVR